MASKSAIEWTDATWNPWYGCRKVSAGCRGCYMYDWARRSGRDPMAVTRSKTKFHDPLKWKEPRMIFTCSLSDFFIEEADAWRDEAFAIMALTPQHTYQILTKRPERMYEYLTNHWPSGITEHLRRLGKVPVGQGVSLSTVGGALPNVWLGVSVEDQKTADERIPLLLQTPAAVRFLSMEPLLGPVDLKNVEVPQEQDLLRRPWDLEGYKFDCLQLHNEDRFHQPPSKIDWVIAGGESGHNARPSHPDWFRSIRDQCTAAGVPFFFKQWGEWAEYEPGENRLVRKGTPELEKAMREADAWISRDGRVYENTSGLQCHPTLTAIVRPGKKQAGRLLDGREWNELPEVSR